MKYEPIDYISKVEAEAILMSNDIKKLRILPLSLGEYCADWKFAQDICVYLLKYSDSEIKANALLGISYIARNHKLLEKNLVEEAIFKAMRSDLDVVSLSRILYSVEDIYLFMGWRHSLKYILSRNVCKMNIRKKKECDAVSSEKDD